MKKFLLCFSAALLIGGTIALAASSAGTSADPLITRSYAEGEYIKKVEGQAHAVASRVLSEVDHSLETELDAAKAALDADRVAQELTTKVAGAIGGRQEREINISADSMVEVRFGSQLSMVSGAAEVTGGTLINITSGVESSVGMLLASGQLYIAADCGATIRVSKAAVMRVSGSAEVHNSGAYQVKYTRYADALKILGLFSGTDRGYELDRVPNRAEGLLMLLRMLGKEQEARNCSFTHPFKDVPGWADRFVAYAYTKGYTSGIDKTKFGSENALSLNDYMTFMLRALGYRDVEGDFSWEYASQKAVECEIITAAEERNLVSRGVFYRDDVAYTTYQTLFSVMKGGERRLYESLLKQGVFTQNQLDQAMVIFS